MSDNVVDAITRVLTEVTKHITDLNANVASVGDAVSTMRSDMATMRSEMATKDNVDRVYTEVWRVRGEILSRLERVQDTLTTHGEADVVNYAASDRAERIARGASDELRALSDQVNAMARQILRLESEVRGRRSSGT